MISNLPKALFLFTIIFVHTQSNAQSKIYTTDITHFWEAYDKVVALHDTATQLKIIQEVYMNKASPGLTDFMRLRDHSAKRHLLNIKSYPKFWTSLRPHTDKIMQYAKEIQILLDYFKTIYPPFIQPDIYFTIGCLNSGGTTEQNMVLIGAEIGVADSTVNASELSTWLQDVFKHNRDVVYLVIHEAVHTQQNVDQASVNLLTNSIMEGAADFITEMILQKPLQSPYIIYGLANEISLWKKFKSEMYGTETKEWLYNGSNVAHPDLGYFMGYAICKSYYKNSLDKTKAISDILNLRYSDMNMINRFLEDSKYGTMK